MQAISKLVEGPPRQEGGQPRVNDHPGDDIDEYRVHVERSVWKGCQMAIHTEARCSTLE